MTSRTQKKNIFSALWQLRTAIILVIVLLITWFILAFVFDQRLSFLPGKTSEGHVLFEAACNACHEGFKPVSNETCERCHEPELAKDAHGEKKFRDPRWAELMVRMDVLRCTACHEEHVPMFGRGVHLKPDLCMTCHEGVITGDIPSHKGYSPDGCWTAGCHNFHDHRSISTAFLRDNLDQPELLPKPALPALLITPTVEQAPAPDLRDEFMREES